MARYLLALLLVLAMTFSVAAQDEEGAPPDEAPPAAEELPAVEPETSTEDEVPPEPIDQPTVVTPPAPLPEPAPAAAPTVLSESEISARVIPAVVKIQTSFASGANFRGGSGVKVAQGILTSNHVVWGADRIEITKSDGTKSPATVSRCNATSDLALLTTSADLPSVDVDPARQRQGSSILSFGYPQLTILTGEATITRGLVSAYRVDETGVVLLQTDAALNPGNSGGPIINAQGKIAAIVVGGLRASEGLNFGIASETVQAFLDDVGRGPCRWSSPPGGNVLLADNFNDPSHGVLEEVFAQRYRARYLQNEFAIQLVEPGFVEVALRDLPRTYANSALTVDVRMEAAGAEQFVLFGCRYNSATEADGYGLALYPWRGEFFLFRFDKDQKIQALAAPGRSTALRGVGESNRVTLACAGPEITASVNGVEIASRTDTQFREGLHWLGIGSLLGTRMDARFDNLVVEQR